MCVYYAASAEEQRAQWRPQVSCGLSVSRSWLGAWSVHAMLVQVHKSQVMYVQLDASLFMTRMFIGSGCPLWDF